jgi:Bacterial pre-peptidase C-terminal domain
MTDNTLAKATALGALDGQSLTRLNSLNKRDRVDFYSFTLGRSSSVNLQLSGLRSNADLTLMNGAGQTMLRSSKGGKQAEQITGDMAAGTYYIKVQGRSGKTTKYKLDASATQLPDIIPPPPPPVGTLNNPIDLGTLTNSTVTQSRQSLPSGGAPTYYKFRLQDITSLNATLSNVSGDSAYVSLYYDGNNNGLPDTTGELITFGSGSPSSSEPVSDTLPATGTYFLVVGDNPSSKGSVYDLIVAPTPIPGNLSTDPGSDASTAYNLGSLSRGGRIEAKDYIGTTLDKVDYYRFNMTESAKVNFNYLPARSGGAQVIMTRLYRDANNNGLIDTDEYIRLLGYSDSEVLQPGNYFMKTEPVYPTTSTAYTLTLTANA